MEHQYEKITSLLLAISFAFLACETVDFTGMILPNESVNDRFEQSMEWNSQYPYREIIVLSDDYTILTMCDSHIGSTNNLDIFSSIAKEINAAAIVMVGDLTTGHTKDYITFQQHIPVQDSLPSFQILGNHDLYFDGWNQFYSRFGASSYIFTVKTSEATDLFICLDTGGGTLGNKQLDWLKDVLRNTRPNYRRCIVLTHNNLFRFKHAATTNPPVEELHVLIELFTKHAVDMVITGHEHKKSDIVFGNTTYIVMDALVDAGYFQLNIINGTIEYKFLNL